MIDHWIKKAIYIYNIAFTGNLDQSIKDIFICNSNKNIPIDEIGVISIIVGIKIITNFGVSFKYLMKE